MPNWCECELVVKGEESELEKFKEFAQTKEDNEVNVLDTNKFIPYPKKFKNFDDKRKKWAEKADEFAKRHGCDCWYCGDKLTDDLRKRFLSVNPEPKDGFNSGGYEWCCENWGTKWGICEASISKIACVWEELEYFFECAWSPCIPVIKKMSKMFPKLAFTLRYFERGLGFSGYLRCEKGRIIENLTGEYFGNRGG